MTNENNGQSVRDWMSAVLGVAVIAGSLTTGAIKLFIAPVESEVTHLKSGLSLIMQKLDKLEESQNKIVVDIAVIKQLKKDK